MLQIHLQIVHEILFYKSQTENLATVRRSEVMCDKCYIKV
jgi:hypothetical protein